MSVFIEERAELSIERKKENVSMKEGETDIINKREGVDYVNEGKGADVSITTDFKGRKADVSK